MKPEDQRITLATRYGWKFEITGDEIQVANPRGFCVAKGYRNGRTDEQFREDFLHNLPNYAHDLNDIAAAVTAQPEEVKHAYAIILAQMLWHVPDYGWDDWRDTLAVSEASARKRLEALLKALDLWIE